MWTSDKWTDYALLDCGGGERLERWGQFTLIRPDPAAVWEPSGSELADHSCDARYLRSASGGGHWETYRKLPQSWQISYRDLKFNVKLMNFKHTGVFPEQAPNWDFINEQLTVNNEPLSVLNLFAYTGAATLAGLNAGASVCHVDAAKGMVDWAKNNAALSGFADKPSRWIVDDCREFVSREIRRGRRYDALIMDPPSYGRGAKGEVWKLEDDLFEFCKLCANVLSEKPKFVLINSYTAGVTAAALTYIAESVFTARFGGRAESRELGLRSESSGLLLPAGTSCRWQLTTID